MRGRARLKETHMTKLRVGTWKRTSGTIESCGLSRFRKANAPEEDTHTGTEGKHAGSSQALEAREERQRASIASLSPTPYPLLDPLTSCREAPTHTRYYPTLTSITSFFLTRSLWNSLSFTTSHGTGAGMLYLPGVVLRRGDAAAGERGAGGVSCQRRPKLLRIHWFPGVF